MGSPDFAVPVLSALVSAYDVIGVVTQPDRPAGRGNKLTPPPVKRLAEELGLEVIQPEKLKHPEAMTWLETKAPDAIVVAAFGQILRQPVLALPPFGCINVHASLLPRWRGASPIQTAILHGDDETGITIMKMDRGIDTGDMLARKTTNILPGETAGQLSDRLAELGSSLLLETLPGWFAGTLTPQPQDDASATYAPMLEKAQGMLDLSKPVKALADQVRAFNPWPLAALAAAEQSYKVYQASVATCGKPGLPGERTIIGGYPAVRAADGWLVLEMLQAPGKKAMDGRAFLAGARDWMAA